MPLDQTNHTIVVKSEQNNIVHCIRDGVNNARGGNPMKNPGLRFLLLIVLVFHSFTSSRLAHAASITVNSLADTKTVDSNCTLREAIENANKNDATNADCIAGSGTDTITFSVSGEITLTTGLPTISDAAGLTVDGTGQALTVSGNNLVKWGTILHDASLTLNNMTVTKGYFATNSGAIENYGTLTITHSIFSNHANGGYDGGAIYNFGGVVTVIDSTFSGNTAAQDGGGIYSLSGIVNIIDSTFSGNTAANGGGIFSYDATLYVTNSIFTGNNAPNGRGGGIHSVYGPLTIINSTFSGNGASWGEGGGAVYADADLLTVVNSIFSGNSATGSPGGAIFNGSTMNITKSTFTSNSAGVGGAIFTEGSNSTIANSTFSGNSATDSPGGGVANTGSLIITNSTLSGNSASSGSGLSRTGGTLTLRNTIVAGNPGGNCNGTITNGGNNLEDGTTCAWGSTFGSMSNTNPLLGTLTGSPAYFPLSGGSPAIEKGDDFNCAAAPVTNQSQNGLTRPQGVHCDIGSYEAAFLPLYLPLLTR